MPLGSPWLSKPIKKPMTDTKIKPDWEKEYDLHFSGYASEHYPFNSVFSDTLKGWIGKWLRKQKREQEEQHRKAESGLLMIQARKMEELKQQHRKELERTEKAFGGCTKCYGKGYSTYREGYQSEPDFIGDKQSEPIMQTHYKPCTCDRGKQIKNLLEQKGK